MLSEQLVPKETTEKAPSTMIAVLVSRDPWWATAPKRGQDEMTLEWGYLEVYTDGSFRFDRRRPSDSEIINRTSCLLL